MAGDRRNSGVKVGEEEDVVELKKALATGAVQERSPTQSEYTTALILRVVRTRGLF